jgi:hypothetical protein
MAFKWKPGNCYKDAWKYVTDVEPSATLVHGIVMASAGGHAWVEIDRGPHKYCIDGFAQTLGGEMPVDEYYARVNARPIAKYTLEEACSRMLETGHFGPWHDDDPQPKSKRSRMGK